MSLVVGVLHHHQRTSIPYEVSMKWWTIQDCLFPTFSTMYTFLMHWTMIEPILGENMCSRENSKGLSVHDFFCSYPWLTYIKKSFDIKMDGSRNGWNFDAPTKTLFIPLSDIIRCCSKLLNYDHKMNTLDQEVIHCWYIFLKNIHLFTKP